MTDPDFNYNISNLIARKMLGTLSEAETEQLERWLAVSAENRSLYDSILNEQECRDRNAYIDSLDTGKAWDNVRRQFAPTSRQHRLWLWRIAVAATIVLTIGGTWFYSRPFLPSVIPPAIATIGSHKAILIAENGEQIVLQDSTIREIRNNEGMQIQNSGHDIVYRVADTNCLITRETYNTIIVPKGGEYRLTLADGSRVWLNSESELYFPVVFNGPKRQVYLKGEAYFQVQKDNHQAFIVHANERTSIEVLGTEFNVEAYPGESVIRTTLNRGKVKVIRDLESIVLLPDQQAIYRNGNIMPEVRSVVASHYSAWKDGKFIFEDADLESIMAKLSRWYSLHIFFRSEDLKNYHFTGDLEKYEDFNTTLHMLEKATRIKFEINGNAVVISKIN